MITQNTVAIMRGLYENGLLRTWFRDRPEGWTLVSGQWSPFYLQLREIGSYPLLLKLVGTAMAEQIASVGHFDRLAGIAYAGIPIAAAASMSSGIPMLMMRKIDGDLAVASDRLGAYGQHSLVEGEMHDGDRILLIDDLVTRFDSKLHAATQMAVESSRRGIDTTCRHVLVILDRGQGAQKSAETNGFSLRALVNFRYEALDLLKDDLARLEYTTITEYLDNPESFQDPKRQSELRQAAEFAKAK